MLMRIQSLNHSTYQHQYHLVWGTKYRRKWLKPYVRADLAAAFKATLLRCPAVQILSMNTDEDPVHLQMEIPPNVAVAEVVKQLKQDSSRNIMKRFGYVRRMYMENSIWAVGYFSSTIGLNEDQIRKYIAYQGKEEETPKQVSFDFS
jgi:putative transposase